MAIMWDPPSERPSLEPTPAELAWKQWLLQVLLAHGTDQPEPPADLNEPPSDLARAA